MGLLSLFLWPFVTNFVDEWEGWSRWLGVGDWAMGRQFLTVFVYAAQDFLFTAPLSFSLFFYMGATERKKDIVPRDRSSPSVKTVSTRGSSFSFVVSVLTLVLLIQAMKVAQPDVALEHQRRPIFSCFFVWPLSHSPAQAFTRRQKWRLTAALFLSFFIAAVSLHFYSSCNPGLVFACASEGNMLRSTHTGHRCFFFRWPSVSVDRIFDMLPSGIHPSLSC